ncbi:MAG TPA: hypothetical protein VE988_13080 [Gemmataceae bacterium]|nr:hypothetical protein [Gemmataceae bacterium]
MIRWITFGNVLCLLTVTLPADLPAQFNPYGKGLTVYGPDADPRVRRAYREKAVAFVGPSGRNFVEAYGDEAVAAIFACTRPVAVKLAEFHNCGEMGKLPRPVGLLLVIAQPRHGDDVALWAIHHAGELADPDSFDAYMLTPLDYALGLKALEQGAAESRARRLHLAAATPIPLTNDQKLAILGGVGVVLIVIVWLWRRKQASMG